MIARKKNYFEVKPLQAAAKKRKTRKARQPKLNKIRRRGHIRLEESTNVPLVVPLDTERPGNVMPCLNLGTRHPVTAVMICKGNTSQNE